MENEWDEYAEGWDTDPHARAYAAAAFESLAAVVATGGPDLADAHVLDFGCGTGLLTDHLVDAGSTVVAVDTSPAMVAVVVDKIAQRGWTTVRASTELPDPSTEFDLIVCSSVCAFLDDYPAAVRDLAARLRLGGRFVQWDWERSGDDDHGLTRESIDTVLRDAGLDEVVVDVGFTVSVDDTVMSPLIGHGRRPHP